MVTTVTIKDVPPSDLLVCPVRPDGLPTAAATHLDPAVAAALERVMPAFGMNARQLGRLINWFAPGSCPEEPANGH